MGELTDKAKAAANKAAGSVKESVGRNQADPDLEAEGKAQKAKGTAQNIKGSIKGALGDDI
ncbi:CsbD family protein [Sphingobium bisphenolivorans]|uniref:CsbD family protein n=1 Tax=Sphingobium bisphenolivorans TaxID=1335760 RepID=UPI0003A41BFD|nr:CsbD family protein [Sphingobium bisphenolivorans]